MTMLGRHIAVSGDVACDDDLTIDGSVKGYVSVREATVTIDTHACVEADVRAVRVVVRGMVRGAIAASERIDLASTASVEGSLSAAQVTIVEGAQFNGTIDMNRRTIAAKVAEYRASRESAS